MATSVHQTTLDELLAEWDAVNATGATASVAALCQRRGCPDLQHELEQRIAMRQRADAPSGEPTDVIREELTGSFREPLPAHSLLSSQDRDLLGARYELLEETGRGGMGIVFRARHRLLDRWVALKICKPGAVEDRFQREARLLASIRSPHVVTVYDFWMLGNERAVLAMEWIDGRDLGTLLRAHQGPIAEARARTWMEEVCLGMIAAAEKGIIHRDLKPSNILIDHHDSAHVADFGVARGTHLDDLTLSGRPMGTPLYLAPEQAEDPHGVDTRADVYGFGATFYHVLTGQPPFEANTPFGVMFKHKMEPLVSPRRRNASLSQQTSACIERCLAKSPAERFYSFQNLLRELREHPPDLHREEAKELAQDSNAVQFRERRALYLREDPSLLPEPDVYYFPQLQTILIGHGDLTKLQVDAVVSDDDGFLTMSGSTSAALCRAAGPEFKDLARAFAPVRAGRVVVTPARNLPARFVFHGITIGSKHGTWMLASGDVLSEIMEACFYHADTLGVQTIAFPLLGTGASGFPKDVCLDTMFRFLRSKFMHGLSSVRQACIVLPARRA